MSSLFFLFELMAFALVAHWTYTNDQLGPKGGFKGLLQMMHVQQKEVGASRKRVPKWRQDHREEPVAAVTGTRRAPQAEAREPAWKRRLR